MSVFWREDRGTAIVEMALVLPILLALILGIVEFGRIVNAYVTVEHAAREGARLGITGASDDDIRRRVEETSFPLDPAGLSVSIDPAPSERTRGVPITVSVTYSYNVITPVMSSLFGAVLQVSSSLSMRME